MIYEMRTYSMRVGGIPEALEKFGQAYSTYKEFKEMAGCFYTDIGPVNQLIQVWAFDDHAEREAVRAETPNRKDWPPGLGDLVQKQEVEIYESFPSVPAFTPGDYGPIYEMRYYEMAPGSIGGTITAWEAALPERTSRSPITAALYTDVGPLNKLVHFWPYRSFKERTEVRDKAVADKIWPPRGGNAPPIVQRNKILYPAPFSPVQ